MNINEKAVFEYSAMAGKGVGYNLKAFVNGRKCRGDWLRGVVVGIIILAALYDCETWVSKRHGKNYNG